MEVKVRTYEWEYAVRVGQVHEKQNPKTQTPTFSQKRRFRTLTTASLKDPDIHGWLNCGCLGLWG